MLCFPQLVGSKGAVACAMVVVFGVCNAAHAQTDQDDSNSRGVRIIDAPTPPPATGSPPQVLKSTDIDRPSPPPLTPALPSQSVAAPTLAPPTVPAATPQPSTGDTKPGSALLTPALEPPQQKLPIPTAPADVSSTSPPTSPNFANVPNNAGAGVKSAAPTLAPPTVPAATPQPSTGDTKPGSALLTPTLEPPQQKLPIPTAPADVSSTSPPTSNNFANVPNNSGAGVHQTQQDLEALSSEIKVPNTAGLSMQILPGPDITAGSQVSFQVASKKPGYLILLDVDAAGKLVQIYPNPMSLMGPSGVREKSNFIQPGKVLQIPDRGSAYSGFEFVAAPPSGTAMVIALLSDHPVQLVDLPDVPASLVGSASSVDYLSKLANELRIPSSGRSDRLEEAHWSFDRIIETFLGQRGRTAIRCWPGSLCHQQQWPLIGSRCSCIICEFFGCAAGLYV